MNRSRKGIPEVAWCLGSDTIHDINKCLINNDNTTVLESVIQKTNECNNCRWNPPIYNHNNGIADTGATQNYIKVDTSCITKVKTHQGPRVILPDGSLTQATNKAKCNLIPLLSTRSKTSHISPPPPPIRFTNLHRTTMRWCMYSHICYHQHASTETRRNITRGNPQRSIWNVAGTSIHHTTTKPQPNTSII